ncbi:MAG: SRPBCC domain-containing protein [Chloroflexi bacterium]|nr:SRPBCC domain-containing protein [Chloroflexota bacterium]
MVRSIELVTDIPASPKAVYEAFTSPIKTRSWLCDYTYLSRYQGNRFLFAWNNGFAATGQYKTLESPGRVALTWTGEGDPGVSTVEVSITEQGEGSRIDLRHTGLGEGEGWDRVYETMSRGWRDSLEHLAYFLSTGLDARVMRRPMIGVGIGFMEEGTAESLGFPTREGILLSGTVEGMGAHDAGLRGNDLLVSMDGHPLKEYGDLATAMAGKAGGDVVEVGYYRGPEFQTVSMRLTERPKPAVQESVAALANLLRSGHVDLCAELDTLLQGASEDDAARRPAPESWSVNENLAHLIFTERFNQMNVFGLMGGDDHYAWPDNNAAQLSPILALYPNRTALVDGFKREMAASAAQIAALPATLMEDVPLYLTLNQIWSGMADHAREHFQQMREALTVVKGVTTAP